ncbi:amidohydrolase [Rhizorhabdus dicambivorans]|uniref:Amidohydrolase n=2 Tax=Rhizorhabdus dicambivorans TaxID=1850238 RepID=A0A2A4FLT6_9SPHN|nr:amidohydrolase [Rhizorhabdus dicambivorans]PCE39705.1 amidohydrolase [Rhizorhabdus dicambivorans]
MAWPTAVSAAGPAVSPNGADLEPIFDPDQAFIDAHHHLWAKGREGLVALSGRPRFLFDDLLREAAGHRLIASVYINSTTSYRADGPVDFRGVGETEFANGQAAASASGLFGPARVGAALVAGVTCQIGDRLKPVLEAHLAAGNGRLRGVRQNAAWDADASIIGGVINSPPGLYRSDAFRAGFRHIGPLGLSFDAFLLSPQLSDVIDLARAFPDTTIVLNHMGNPVGTGRYAGKMKERFPIWKRDLQALAKMPRVYVKIGGLGAHLAEFKSYRSDPPAHSKQIAAEWRPYMETAIEIFGVHRCMFESNYPVESGTGSYRTIVNALKRVAAPFSAEERQALFVGAAADCYRLDLAALPALSSDRGTTPRAS